MAEKRQFSTNPNTFLVLFVDGKRDGKVNVSRLLCMQAKWLFFEHWFFVVLLMHSAPLVHPHWHTIFLMYVLFSEFLIHSDCIPCASCCWYSKFFLNAYGWCLDSFCWLLYITVCIGHGNAGTRTQGTKDIHANVTATITKKRNGSMPETKNCRLNHIANQIENLPLAVWAPPDLFLAFNPYNIGLMNSASVFACIRPKCQPILRKCRNKRKLHRHRIK